MNFSNVRLVFVVMVVFLCYVICINHRNLALFDVHNRWSARIRVVVKKTKHLLIQCLHNAVRKAGYSIQDIPMLLKVHRVKVKREDRESERLFCFTSQLGGGCEPEQHYALWKRLHRHLDKQNVLQESFMKLMDGEDR